MKICAFSRSGRDIRIFLIDFIYKISISPSFGAENIHAILLGWIDYLKPALLVLTVHLILMHYERSCFLMISTAVQT